MLIDLISIWLSLVPALYIVVTVAICLTLLIYDTFNTGLGLAIVALGTPVYYFAMPKTVIWKQLFS
jgi:hypothetical protein